MEVFVRAATVADLPELARLDRLTFGANAYAPGVSRQLLQVFPGLTLLGQDGGGVAHAFCYGALAAGSPTGWILALGVEPLHRRAGYGSVIVEELLQRLTDLEAGRVRLTCAPDARETLAFYAELRFSAVERVEDYLGPGRHRLILERRLAAARTTRSAGPSPRSQARATSSARATVRSSKGGPPPAVFE
jgi:ribosomal-protein-alanine N-acetyltransferase